MKEKARQGYRLHLLIIVMIAAAIIGGFFSLFLQNLAVRYHWTLPLPELQAETPAETETAEETPVTEGGGSTVATRILPSVVGIKATGTALSEGLPAVTESSGSGVVIDSRGYIVTNYHVIAGAEEFRVIFHDDSEASATVVGSDQRTDLALLKVEKEGLTAAAFAEDSPAVGDAAYAIGSPGGLDFAGTVTKGIVSGLNRTLVTDDGGSFSLIQTDAAINPGNSGGALCNEKGEVIGINTLKISETGFEGMGFALPAQTVQDIAEELLTSGSVSRGALGVYLLCDVDEAVNAGYHIGIDHGVMISLQEGGAAAKAGLKDYDIITAFGGEPVADMYSLQQKVFAQKAGAVVSVTVFRNGEERTLSVTLEELKE